MSLQPMSNPNRQRGGAAGLLTVLLLLLTGLVFACYVAIFVNPQLPINPFPPQPVMVMVTPVGGGQVFRVGVDS